MSNAVAADSRCKEKARLQGCSRAGSSGQGEALPDPDQLK